MDKLAAIRIYDGQNYSDEIPVTALAENIQWDESSTLIDILGSINLTHKGNIQDQIDELNNRINNIHDSVVSVNGKTGTVILNAADVGAGTGNYNKPISGIPKTDLASSVQTSLEKADSALQSYTETDPTVPAWAKQPNKPTYTAQEVGALPADSQITVEVDDTLSIQGAAADAKAVGDALASNTNVSRIIASTYNDSNTYNIGSLVLYNGLLYRCRTKIETPEAWTRVHWDLLTIDKSLTPLELGQLWSTCNTAENTLDKVISLFSYDDTQYNPKPFGIIGVYFYNAVPANSTLNINNTGAKPIYKGPNPIGDNEIKAGDTAYFMLNGIGRFEFLGVDSYGTQIKIIKQDLEIQQTRAETAQALKINKPVTNPNGTQGQILQTDGQGGTIWVNKQTDEQIGSAVTDWLDDHVTPGGSTIVVDDTLSIQGAAADAKKTGDEISDLKDGLIYSKGVAKETKNGLTLYEPDNLLDITRVTNGYITKNGDIRQSTSYFYTDYIPVNEGDVIGFYNFSGVGMIGRGTISARFLAAYDANKAIISSAGSDTTVSSYTVPNGVAYIRASLAMSYKPLNPFISKNGAPISYSAGFQSKLVPQAQAGRHFYRYKCDSSFYNETFEIPTMSLCKNTIISFSGYVKAFTFLTFKLSIGQGTNHFGATWIDIDKDNVTWHLYTSSDSSYPQAHGLPFDTVTSGQISISIIVGDNTKAKLTIEYGGQQYTRTLGFYGFSDQPFYVTSSAIHIEKESFSVTNKDFDAPIFTFGDSYIAIIESESKWTHYYVADGFGDNMCINAFPGADSAELANAFNNTLAIATPQKILWCVGMNDGSDADLSTPNTQWMASVENMLAVCKAKNIEPLFVTIPTVPTVNNEAKNKWIRESGYRFADFALAVGADSSGVWNTDMLSSDRVHPSALGAKAMYYQLMADLPDLFV